MSDGRAQCDWVSAHLYFGGDVYGPVAGAVALDVVAPVIARCQAEGLTSKHFFIRYRDIAPHLRLRLRVSPGDAHLVAQVLLDQLRACAPGADVEPFGMPALHAAAPRLTLWPERRVPTGAAVGALRWIPYQPELARYGGTAAAAVAEDVFAASSDVCVRLLDARYVEQRSGRLGRALAAMLVALHACFDDRTAAAAFAHRYGEGYLRALGGGAEERTTPLTRAFEAGFDRQADVLAERVEAVWGYLEAGEVPAELEDFRAALTRARTALTQLCVEHVVVVHGTPMTGWWDCARIIVPSYVHMMNNRLGVRIAEEAYLAHLLRWTLDPSGSHADPTIPASRAALASPA